MFVNRLAAAAAVLATVISTHPDECDIRGGVSPRLEGRIVGGEEINIADIPYQLSLMKNGKHICGASIIGWKFALTAAHCTDGSSASDLSVRAGSTILNNGGEVYYVRHLYQHPQYHPVLYDYDVSVLVLSEGLRFSPSIKRIAIPAFSNTSLPVGRLALVSGWGAKYRYGKESTQLNAVMLRIISQEECRANLAEFVGITDRICCAGVPDGGKDACQGDSGGPLVVDDVLIGIVSAGIGCGLPNIPGMYTSVASVRDFIKKVSNI